MGRINIHRTYIPESDLGPGVLVQSYYEFEKSIPCISKMQVYYVDNSIVGKDDEEAAGQGYKPFIPKDERDV